MSEQPGQRIGGRRCVVVQQPQPAAAASDNPRIRLVVFAGFSPVLGQRRPYGSAEAVRTLAVIYRVEQTLVSSAIE
jgi:hypothetical protein